MKEFLKDTYLLLVKIILTIYILYALKFLYRLKNIESEFYMNITFIFLIIIIYLLVHYTLDILKDKMDKRLVVISLTMGLYFAFILLVGTYYEGVAIGPYYKSIADFTFEQINKSKLYIPALWFMSFCFIFLLYVKIPEIYNKYINKYSYNVEMPKIFNNLYKIWFFIFICWLPYFILLYPGYINWDAEWQIKQLFSGNFHTHHPLITTFYMYFIKLYYIISDNAILSVGLFVILFQMIPLSFINAYMITKLDKIYNINKPVMLFIILFIALYPSYPLNSIILEKGVLFLIFFILFILKIIEIVENKKMLNKKNIILLIIFGALLCLTKKNAIYSLFLMFPLILLFAKEFRLKILIIYAGIFIVYTSLSMFFLEITHANKGEFKSAMAIPVQQLTRVYKYHQETLSVNEKDFIEQMFIKEFRNNFSDGYAPKDLLNLLHKTNSQYFKSTYFIRGYINLGLKYPGTYMNAFLMKNSPLLYSFSNNFFRQGMDITTFDYYSPMLKNKKNDIIKHKNKLLHDYMITTQWRVDKNNSMLMFVLMNPSFIFYFFVLSFVYFLYKKQYQYNFILLFPLGYTITIMLGPVIYMRYILYLVFLIPIIVIMLTSMYSKKNIG